MNPVGLVIACALVALGTAAAPDNTYDKKSNDNQYRAGLYFNPSKNLAGNYAPSPIPSPSSVDNSNNYNNNNNNYKNDIKNNKNKKSTIPYDFNNSDKYDDFYSKEDNVVVKSNNDNGNKNYNNNNQGAYKDNNQNKYNGNYFTRFNGQYYGPSVNYVGSVSKGLYRSYQYSKDVQVNSGSQDGYNPKTNSYDTPQVVDPSYSQSSNSKGQAYNGQASNGQYNNGQYNNGKYNNGKYNNGQYNNDQYKNGQYNNGQYNNDQYTNGQYNNDQYKNDQYNNGQYNNDQYKNGQYNNDQYKNGPYNNDQYKNGQYNNGQYNNAGQMNYNANPSSYSTADKDSSIGVYPCGKGDEGKKYEVIGVCYAYFECVYGESLYRECDDYYKFDAYSGKCVADKSCAYCELTAKYLQ